jgi:chromosome partitioning protein
MRTLAVYNVKGGVGKTSTAVNLAYLAAEEGCRTLLWDLDPQGAASFLLKVRPRVKGGGKALLTGRRELLDAARTTDFELLDLLPADFSYRHFDRQLDHQKRPTRRLTQLLRQVEDDYDVVVLDCPPNISLLSENIFAAANLLLVPLVPATLSLRTYEQVLDVLDEMPGHRPPVAAFFSMVDGRKRLHHDVMEAVRREHPGTLVATVPAASEVERMGLTREPVPVSDPSGRVADAYRLLWREVRSLLV